ncbi:MAG TPA: glycine--tRNA ligase subunit beta, partial [Anaerolineales bacterium]|nr:glycine--tRNA ligase subunit beta [Anaerolineales bacterium]
PTAVMGGFNEEFLELPRDVLISVMKKHQRYFPVQGSKSKVKGGQPSNLLPHFIAIRNGDDIGVDTVRQGNEHVLNARFADANFFVREDLKQPLEDYRNELAGLIFHTKLGSMLDKSERIEKLVNELIPMRGLEKDEAVFARRAAHLMKADLVTQMVTEMTSLQGIIGGEYALRSGETKEVATAISEQYQTVPQSKAGLAIALADRLDSLVGLFAAGLAPTGAKDPFGLRRAAIGIVQPLIEHDMDFDLAEAVKRSAKTQPIEVDDETQAKILEFITGRLSVALKDMDAARKHDVVEAVLAEQSANPAASARAVKQLSVWVGRDDWSTILDGFARCVRITRDQKERYKVKEKSLREIEERTLYEVLNLQNTSFDGDVDALLKVVLALIPPITSFFDEILVMAEEKEQRENRLGLLQKIAGLSDGVADLSKLDGF